MSNNQDKTTTITSICVILLRETRVERGLHQAQIADWIGKTPSAWTKIEGGKSPLQFETFIRVCHSMRVTPSAVLATAERYATLLSQNNWNVVTSEVDLSKDGLLRLAQEYWGSPGCRNTMPNQWGFVSALSGPTYNPDNSISLSYVFQFVIDPEFRELQLQPQPF